MRASGCGVSFRAWLRLAATQCVAVTSVSASAELLLLTCDTPSRGIATFYLQEHPTPNYVRSDLGFGITTIDRS